MSPDWWIGRIPADVRQRAEERKKKSEKPWPWLDRSDSHPIYYVDFGDYAKIILRKDNWRQVFQPIFGDAEIVSAKLRELEPIRNAIAHNRELTRREKSRFGLLASDIISSLVQTRSSHHHALFQHRVLPNETRAH